MKLTEYMNGRDVQAFADEIGIHYTTVYKLMSGVRRASPKLAHKIAEATEGAVTLEDLRPDFFHGDAA